MQTGWNENKAILRGTVAAAPAPSHENHGVWYDAFPLTVQRLEDGEYQEQTVTITLGPKSDLNETEAAQES